MNLGPLWKQVDKELENEHQLTIGSGELSLADGKATARFYDLFYRRRHRAVWVCEYCGRQTFEPHESCNGCGAPLDLKGNE